MQLQTSHKWIAALVVALASGAVAFLALRSKGPASIPFQTTAWIQAPSGDWYPRHLMIEDFLQNHPLRGLSKTEVIALLGQPQWEAKNEMEYGLRIEYGHGTEPSLIQSFVIQFDSSNRVVSYHAKKWPSSAA